MAYFRKKGAKHNKNIVFTLDCFSMFFYRTSCYDCQPCQFTRLRCTDILKALVLFVADHPPSVAANLFQPDQTLSVNLFTLFDLSTKRTRNWVYVFAKLYEGLLKDGKLPWLQEYPLLLAATVKANAAMMADFMKSLSKNPPCGLDAKVVALLGYWVAKLYSVSIYRTKVSDLPKPILMAYNSFIAWKGKICHSLVPALNPEDFQLDSDTMMAMFPFSREFVAMECISKAYAAIEQQVDATFSVLSLLYTDVKIGDDDPDKIHTTTSTNWNDDDERFMFYIFSCLSEDSIRRYCVSSNERLSKFYMQENCLSADELEKFGSDDMGFLLSDLRRKLVKSSTPPNCSCCNRRMEQVSTSDEDDKIGNVCCKEEEDNEKQDVQLPRPRKYKKSLKKDSEWKLPFSKK